MPRAELQMVIGNGSEKPSTRTLERTKRYFSSVPPPASASLFFVSEVLVYILVSVLTVKRHIRYWPTCVQSAEGVEMHCANLTLLL